METSTQPRPGVADHTVGGSGPRPAHRRRRDDRVAALGFLTPAILTFTAFVLAPTVGVLVLSFYDWNLLRNGKFIGFDNFVRLAGDNRLFDIYGSTAAMALAILVVNVALGLLLAVLLETRMPRWLRGFFRLSFLFPFVVSAAAVALIWRFLLNRDLGLVNYVLGLADIDRINWLGSSAWAPVAVVLVSSWKTIGFSILIYIAGLQSIPSELHEAATMDGAGAWTRFWRITFPLLSPIVFFLVVINMINSFQLFAEPRVLTQGGPGDSSRTIVQYIYDRAFGDFDLGYASAIGITFALLLVAMTAVQFWFSRRWTYYG